MLTPVRWQVKQILQVILKTMTSRPIDLPTLDRQGDGGAEPHPSRADRGPTAPRINANLLTRYRTDPGLEKALVLRWVSLTYKARHTRGHSLKFCSVHSGGLNSTASARHPWTRGVGPLCAFRPTKGDRDRRSTETDYLLLPADGEIYRRVVGVGLAG
jgi:hypothetical protein